jgi:branched-subunit amino acid aminotransferase/4-amino-4-deoxychorismate lyase
MMNIAIRTAITDYEDIIFNSGGGIVIDSNPIDEYVECLHKAKHIANFFGKTFVGHLAWHNGKILPNYKLSSIPFYEKLFESKNFIDGCFETISIENGLLQNLYDHLARLKRGFEYFEIKNIDEKIPKEDDLALLAKINLAHRARLRIACYIIRETKEFHSIVQIFPYQDDSSPIHLIMSEVPFNVPKEVKDSKIKTLDYIRYKNSFEKANKKGYWAEILYDERGIILETGKANLYFKFHGKWFTPMNNIIGGTKRAILIKEKSIVEKNIKIEEIVEAEEVGVSNALIGFQNVHSILKNNPNTQKDEVIWKWKV